MELYKQFRPKKLADVVGQRTAVNVLQKMIDTNSIPHALLLTGPSGCGKTTIARILRKHLKCHSAEFNEVNIADIRGIENIRDIRKRMNLVPLRGKTKIWLLDECHKLSSDAMHASLKMLEDTPSHVYFFLATTDPHKLLKTIRTRCTEVVLKPIGKKDLAELVMAVFHKAIPKGPFPKLVIDEIVDNSDGSARKALVLLDSIINLASKEEMLEAIEKSTQEAQAIQLCRLLIDPRTQWSEVSKRLKELEEEDAEGLRRMVLSYMRSVMLGGKQMASRAYSIMCVFERNFYDTGNAGLVLACWEVFHSSK